MSEAEEVMHDRYEIEVGDIVQVTEAPINKDFYKLGDIGRVVKIYEHRVDVDFSLSKNPSAHATVGNVWIITTKFITKINVIQEGDSRTDADRQEEYDNEEEL